MHKQGLHVSWIEQVITALVAPIFHCELPSLVRQLSVDDLHKVGAVFSEARRWLLTSNVSNSDYSM